MDLSEASDDVLMAILRHLDPSDVARASLCNRAWCRAAEASFEARCREKGWRLPRRPRGRDAHTKTPWRRLFRNDSCIRCVDGPGEFRVSRVSRARVFSLCKQCVGEPDVVEQLQRWWGLRVDIQSVDGKMLPGIELKKGNKKERSTGEIIDRGIRGFG